jgi:hypothetical protein
LPNPTPPAAPVVQKVIGPLEVPTNKGLAADADAELTVIRPTDFRVNPLPAAEELTLA